MRVSKNTRAVLQALEAKGFTLTDGRGEYGLGPDEVAGFLRDPVQWRAGAYGVFRRVMELVEPRSRSVGSASSPSRYTCVGFPFLPPRPFSTIGL